MDRRGIVLGIRRHGEANAILELMTRATAAISAWCAAAPARGCGRCCSPATVRRTWRARLDEHLGHYAVEALDARAASFLPVSHALYGVTHLAALCRMLPERDPHRRSMRRSTPCSMAFSIRTKPARSVVRFEMQLLAELGFGLDLATCAATGEDRRSRLCFAEIGTRGLAARRAHHGRTDCWPCRLPVTRRRTIHRRDVADGFA